jgi:hypothetical protein
LIRQPVSRTPSNHLASRIDAALDAADLQQARSLLFHWLDDVLAALPAHPSRQQLRQPELWRCLAAVVERTSDHYLLERFWQAMDQVCPPPQAPGAPLPLLGVPILNRPDLLERLLASLDHPVEVLAIVDNSGGGSAASPVAELLEKLETSGHPLVGSVRVARPFGNAGVAASWNLILRGFPDAPLALLANNDVMFCPGVLAEALAQINAAAPQFLPLLPAPQEFSAFLLTARCWDRLGLFDPGFYPAYCEDLDYRDRLHADPDVRWLELPSVQAAMAAANAQSSATIASDPELAARNHYSFPLNKLWWLSHRRLRHDPRGTWLRQWLAEWKD